MNQYAEYPPEWDQEPEEITDLDGDCDVCADAPVMCDDCAAYYNSIPTREMK
jgi:hypothetical protein